MTAHALKGDRERCLEAGMDGYTSKPIDAEELFAAIESLVPPPEAADVPADRLAGRGGPDARAGGGGNFCRQWLPGRGRIGDRLDCGPEGGPRRRAFAANDRRYRLGRDPQSAGGNPPGGRRGRFPGPAPGGAHAQRIDPLFRSPKACWNRPCGWRPWAKTVICEGVDEVLSVLDQIAGQLMAALARTYAWQGNMGTTVESKEVTP